MPVAMWVMNKSHLRDANAIKTPAALLPSPLLGLAAEAELDRPDLL